MRRYFTCSICFLLLLFSCSNLLANNSTFQLLGSREGDPESIVEGVSTIHGDYSEIEVDLVVPGPDPLVLSRFYSSNDNSTITDFGGWRLFPKCRLFIEKDSKRKTYTTSEGKFDREYLRVGTDEESILTYVGWKNTTDRLVKSLYKVDVDDRVFNMANIARGNPHSWTNQKNNEIYYQAESDLFELVLSNQGKRFYLKHPSKKFYYLDREILPSGNKVLYEYDSEGQPKFIKLTNSKEEKILSWIKIQYGELINIESSDKKTIQYHFEQQVNSRVLTKVLSSHKPSIIYKYQTNQDHSLLIRKELPGGRYTAFEYQLDDGGKYKVCALKKPVTDSVIARREFIYQKKDDRGGSTLVQGPLGEKTIYYYNEDFQLTSIEEYLNASLYRTQRRLWGLKRDACNLIQTSIEDASNNVHYVKTFSYDGLGNIIRQKEYGNFTGAHPDSILINDDGCVDENQQGHVKTFSYKQTDDFDIVDQTDMKGSGVRSFYKKGTNLLAKKYILKNKDRKKRWFYKYNEDGVLTHILIDDGSAPDAKSTFSLKHRFITKITPKQEMPGIGAPEIIEEKFLDVKDKQEKLIKRTVNHFDGQGNIVKQEIYDANGDLRYTLKKSYGNGLLKMETDLLGNEKRYTYDEVHNLIQEDNALTGTSVQYEYDLGNHIVRTIEKVDNQVFQTYTSYNASGYKVSETDRFENMTFYSLDDLGRVKTVTYPEISKENGELFSPSYSYEYDLFGHVTNVIDPYGVVTTRTNTPRGSPIQIDYADKTQEFFEYDPEGSLHRHINKNGTVQAFEYEYMGRPSQVKYYSKSGSYLSSTNSTYDAFYLKSTKDKEGTTTNYSYDWSGRLISLKKDSQKVEFFYDSLGRKVGIKKWKSSDDFTYEKMEYDLLGNLIQETTESSKGTLLTKTEYSYDKAGRLFEIIGYPHNEKSTLKCFEYDFFSRLCKETDSLGFSTKIIYDDGFINEWGQRVLKKIIVDPLDNRTEEIYDTAGNIASYRRKDSTGKVLSSSQIFYNALGNEVLRKDSVINLGETTRTHQLKKSYLLGNHLVEIRNSAESQEERLVQFTYNNDGNLCSRLDPGVSSPITYEYNKKGYLEKILFQEEGVQNPTTYKIGYDIKGNLTNINMSAKLSIIYKFNANNQLINETVKDAFGSYTVKSSHEGEGYISEIQLPDGSFIQYEYEGPFVKKVTRVSKEKQELYQYKVFLRDLIGNILEEILPCYAGSRKLCFDKSGRKTQIITDFFQDIIPEDGYDPVGNIRSREIVLDDENSSVSYDYDALYQLLSEKGDVELNYSYDSIGNRLSKNRALYTLNDANQLIADEKAIYTFDSRGNLASKSMGERTWEFRHNRINQLTLIKLPDDTKVSFTYDLSGKRLSKRIEKEGSSKIFRYFYLDRTELGCIDEKGIIIELRIPSNPNQPEREPFIAFELNKETYVPVYDIQGNVACLIDPERRKIQESYKYSAFGEEEIFNHRGRKMPHSVIGNSWRYRGNRIDEETGLICIGYRYYDPDSGRWISPDPAGDIDGPNLYVYCRNNPLTYVDYYGLASELNPNCVCIHHGHPGWKNASKNCVCICGEGAILKRYSEAKSGGDIGNTIKSSIGSAVDFSLEVLSNPRVQGSLQAFAGLAEAGAGGLATLTSGIAAPVGWPVMIHGLDQFFTGLSTAISGTHNSTVTEQALQAAGISSEWASFTNNALSFTGTIGGSAIIRNGMCFNQTSKAVLSGGVTRRFNNSAEFERYKTLLRAQMEKPYVVDSRLKDLIDVNYRSNASIGSGSTAAAIRSELATGRKVFNKLHSQKGGDMIKPLEKWLKNNPTARLGDRAAAENIIKDLRNALGD